MNYKHGLEGTRIYSTWENMKSRCTNLNVPSYKDYGMRNIKVCNEWLDFTKFYSWAMENGYKENLQIDRINNDEGYNPNNCRWVTLFEQQNNKRNVHVFEIDNIKYTAKELSIITGVNIKTLYSRKYRKSKLLNTMLLQNKKQTKEVAHE